MVIAKRKSFGTTKNHGKNTTDMIGTQEKDMEDMEEDMEEDMKDTEEDMKDTEEDMDMEDVHTLIIHTMIMDINTITITIVLTIMITTNGIIQTTTTMEDMENTTERENVGKKFVQKDSEDLEEEEEFIVSDLSNLEKLGKEQNIIARKFGIQDLVFQGVDI